MGMQMIDVQKIKKELGNKKAILDCAKEFNMVGDPTRLKICYLLCHHKELSVGEITKIIGVSISAVSHTLKRLQKAGMLENRREFRSVYYKLKQTSFARMLKERLKPL